MPEGFRPAGPVSDCCEYPQSWPPTGLPLLEASLYSFALTAEPILRSWGMVRRKW